MYARRITMKLSELFEILQYSEMAGTGVLGLKNDDGIPVAKYPQVISYVNRGLTQLHTEFLLKEAILTIQHIEGRTDYPIDIKYAVSDPAVEDKYILDTVDTPYIEDLIKIEYMVDEVGDIIVMNDADDPLSYFTPGFKTIQVAAVNVETVFHVAYRARHAIIPMDTTDLTTVEIGIPDNFIDALIYYVASKAYATVNSTDSRQASIAQYQYYLVAVKMLKDLNMGTNGYSVINRKGSNNGWV